LVATRFKHFAAAIKNLGDFTCRRTKFFTQIKSNSRYHFTFGDNDSINAGKSSSGNLVSWAILRRVISYNPAGLQCSFVNR